MFRMVIILGWFPYKIGDISVLPAPEFPPLSQRPLNIHKLVDADAEITRFTKLPPTANTHTDLTVLPMINRRWDKNRGTLLLAYPIILMKISRLKQTDTGNLCQLS